ncbi:hypothetical protein BO71DRAFT_403388 [Aspergillus ellipticus CBS 707.79]|uniref:Uncharacterized protein n=1 Tax=Aspergillus ellipticus CBS 707.79 TaxID=1448320 RepID=A0A319DDE7_9EURO|nr:hypothetical protein BO71DRAFT_403388 [Aspergillus ellipticus CBS 707.79]
MSVLPALPRRPNSPDRVSGCPERPPPPRSAQRIAPQRFKYRIPHNDTLAAGRSRE